MDIELTAVTFNRNSKHGLFTSDFIPPDSELPLGYEYIYYLRGSDFDAGRPASAESSIVRVNFCGTLLSPTALVPKKGQCFFPIRGFYLEGRWRSFKYKKNARNAKLKLVYNVGVFENEQAS